MLKYFSADWIFPVSRLPIQNGVVAIDADGEIKGIFTEKESEQLDVAIEKFVGAIVPGFVNTHCHLELSHMLAQIPEHTGLVKFVQHILSSRQADATSIISAMQNADNEMVKNGIVAVGDISNQSLSKAVKQQSRLIYHTFVEALGFNPESAAATMEHVSKIRNEFSPLTASIVPHAPYSVSPALFELINKTAEKENALISIHNQETHSENDFFMDKTGEFLELYRILGVDIGFFQPTGKSSIKSWLPYIKKQKMLLVHNTVSGAEDVVFAKQNHHDLYWCLCPQANLYIEDTLPDVDLLIKHNCKITLGTDSLASNHQLNILSEMKTLQDHKETDFEKLLQWATINGAEFLELDHKLGSIDVGKRPGLNLIQLSEDCMIQEDLVVKLV